MKLSVIGTGYVGLVSGACLADTGYDVTCHDIDPHKITALDQGQIPIYEPGLEAIVARNGRAGRLRFTTSIASALEGAEACFIAVGTPQDADGSADVRAVLDVARAIAQSMRGPLVIAVKSTVPVGTCERVQQLIDAHATEYGLMHRFAVVSNPEFLKEGKAIEDFMRPDRIVVGADQAWAAEVMRAIYGPFIRNGHPFLLMDVRSSELTKYACNVMLATRISLINELALLCDKVGADIMRVRQGLGSDSRIGKAFLYPGIGYGGSCFPKDVLALSRLALQAECPAGLFDAVDRVNRHQKGLLANRILQRFGDVRGKQFALWGLAFKPETDDIREAPALTIIKRLTDAGATVLAYDPQAMERARAALAANTSFSLATNAYAALEGADALLIATEWREFLHPDFGRMRRLLRQPLVFDGRNLYDPASMAQLGFSYVSIGRPAV
jgi:UDPglucose 6-dehydrogenase